MVGEKTYTGCEEIVLSDCKRGDDTESKIKLNLKHQQQQHKKDADAGNNYGKVFLM